MEEYSLRNNPQPFKYQTTLPHRVLYKLDRKYVLEKEKFTEREMISYDRRINNEKLRILTQKGFLIKEITNVLKGETGIKFGFNEYNGYWIVFNKYQFETFNYLKLDIIKQILSL